MLIKTRSVTRREYWWPFTHIKWVEMRARISRFAVKGYALQERVLRARFDAFIAPVDFLLYIVYKVRILWLC